MLFKLSNNRCNRLLLLTDRNVDTLNAGPFLIDNRIDRNSGLPRLAVSDNQLALSTSNWNHGIDRFQSRLNGLINRFTSNYARRNLLDWLSTISDDISLTINRVSKRVNDTT